MTRMLVYDCLMHTSPPGISQGGAQEGNGPMAAGQAGQLSDVYGNSGTGGAAAPSTSGTSGSPGLEKQIETNLGKLLLDPGLGLSAATHVLGNLNNWLKTAIKDTTLHIPGL